MNTITSGENAAGLLRSSALHLEALGPEARLLTLIGGIDADGQNVKLLCLPDPDGGTHTYKTTTPDNTRMSITTLDKMDFTDTAARPAEVLDGLRRFADFVAPLVLPVTEVTGIISPSRLQPNAMLFTAAAYCPPNELTTLANSLDIPQLSPWEPDMRDGLPTGLEAHAVQGRALWRVKLLPKVESQAA